MNSPTSFVLPDIMQPLPEPDKPTLGARAVTVAASPMSYTARTREALHITGGTISVASLIRGSVTLGLGIVAAGQLIELNVGDIVRLTYVTPPTITILPR